jgi:hypothetical protein
MTLIGKPYSLILLEVEEAITGKGENRPLIVEAAYKRIIKEYGANLTEDERVCLGAFRIIMEELALKNVLQIDAGRLIQANDAVQRWGINKVPDWAELTPPQQLARILGGITPPAKAKAHDIIVADGKSVQGSLQKFDFDDPKATTAKVAKVFIEDILKQIEDAP